MLTKSIFPLLSSSHCTEWPPFSHNLQWPMTCLIYSPVYSLVYDTCLANFFSIYSDLFQKYMPSILSPFQQSSVHPIFWQETPSGKLPAVKSSDMTTIYPPHHYMNFSQKSKRAAWNVSNSVWNVSFSVRHIRFFLYLILSLVLFFSLYYTGDTVTRNNMNTLKEIPWPAGTRRPGSGSILSYDTNPVQKTYGKHMHSCFSSRKQKENTKTYG